jgi:hypothetical protein
MLATVGLYKITYEDRSPHSVYMYRYRRTLENVCLMVLKDAETDTAEKVLAQAIAVPEVAKFLGVAYSVEDDGAVISLIPRRERVLYADPNDDRLVQLTLNGTKVAVTPADMYDQCPQYFIRETVGCEDCSLRTSGCGREEYQALAGLITHYPQTNLKHRGDCDEAVETLKRGWVAAGHTWLSSAYTATTDKIAPKYRPINEHDFSSENIERRKADRSSAGYKAGVTRKFIKTACSVCPARAYGCDAAARCTGPYPTLKALDAGCKAYADQVEAVSKITYEDVQRLSRYVGLQFRDGRHIYVFAGFKISPGHKLVAAVSRKVYVRNQTYYETVDELLNHINSTKRRKKDPNIVPTPAELRSEPLLASNEYRSLFYASAAIDRTKHETRGFRSSGRAYLAGASANQFGVTVCKAHNDQWRYRHELNVDDMDAYYRLMEALPGQQRALRPGSRLRIHTAQPLIREDGTYDK